MSQIDYETLIQTYPYRTNVNPKVFSWKCPLCRNRIDIIEINNTVVHDCETENCPMKLKFTLI